MWVDLYLAVVVERDPDVSVEPIHNIPCLYLSCFPISAYYDVGVLVVHVLVVNRPKLNVPTYDNLVPDLLDCLLESSFANTLCVWLLVRVDGDEEVAFLLSAAQVAILMVEVLGLVEVRSSVDLPP